MKKFLVVAIAICVMTYSASALTFKTGNARANALGGAYTALGEGSLGAFYNPAALAGQKGFDLTFGFNAGMDNYVNEDVIKDVDDFIDLLDKTYNTLGEANAAYNQASVLFQKIQNQVNGNPYLVKVEPDFDFGLRFKNFSLYAATTNIAYVNANLDSFVLNGTDLQPNDTTTISGYASVIGEVGLSYGFNCGKFSDSLKQLDMGLTIKGIGGVNKALTRQLKNFDDFAEDDLEIDEVSLDNIEVSCDLGLRYSSKDNKFSIGIIGKNLTSPKVDSSDETNGFEIKIDPMVRLGICWKPFKRITFAADIDLTENEVAVFENVKYKSQQFGAGLEIRPFNWKRFDLPIRVGYSTNMAESGSSNVITGGIGIKLPVVCIDISGGIDDGFEYKEREKFGNVNISLYW